jgi:hypothetical protein
MTTYVNPASMSLKSKRKYQTLTARNLAHNAKIKTVKDRSAKAPASPLKGQAGLRPEVIKMTKEEKLRNAKAYFYDNMLLQIMTYEEYKKAVAEVAKELNIKEPNGND